MSSSSFTSDNDNNDTQNENISEKKRKGGSQKKSWVWEWFDSDEFGAKCQVEVISGQLCNKHYKNGSSTGNLIHHLINKHQVTEGMRKQDFVVSKNINLQLSCFTSILKLNKLLGSNFSNRSYTS